MKNISLVISLIAVVLAIFWYFNEPGFEPAITGLLGIAGIIGSFTFGSSRVKNSEIQRQFEALKARWFAEKELAQASLDDARWIISEILDFLHQVRIAPKTDKHHQNIDKLTLEFKRVQNMQIYIDGGKTYRQFWDKGTSSIEELGSLMKKI